jgi:N-acetylneuraminic acid mutarotase
MDNAVASQGGLVYTFSGVSNGALTPNSYKYNPATNAWTAIAPLPAAREEASAVSDGTYIYILGGADSTGAPTNTVYRYDPVANIYTTLLGFSTPSWAQAVAVAGGAIYKIAGCATNCTSFLNVVEKFDLGGGGWTTVAPYPQAIGWLMATGYNGQIYAAGGTNAAASNKTYRYDPATDTWGDAAFADMPGARWGSANGILGSAWTLAGGYAPAMVSNITIAYSFALNIWSDPLPMAVERARFGGATAGSGFYTVGGRSSAGGFTGTSTTQRVGGCGPTSTPVNTLTPTPTPPISTPSPTATPTCGSTPSWQIVSSPNVGTGANTLNAVVAVSVNDAWAVGNTVISPTNSSALIERWDGTAWNVVPAPETGRINTLYGVDSASANDVWAVGSYLTGTSTLPLILHWDGSAWGQPSVAVASTNANLRSVTAISATDVWAVGSYYNGSNSQTLTVHWNGSAWSVVPSPNGQLPDSGLMGVSATSPSDVWAVGLTSLTFNQLTLVLHWNGSAWAQTSSPSPGFEQNQLLSVAAISPNDAWAVGLCYCRRAYEALTIHWDGALWRQVTTPDLGTASPLSSVSAVAINDVWAVGSLGVSGGSPLAMHWNGLNWSAVFTPAGTPSSGFYGVAARTATDVWAVGYQNGSNSLRTFIERYAPGACASPTPTSTATVTHTPTATPTGSVTPACTITFSDVHPADYFYVAVQYLACHGVISGYADGTFRPFNNTTRGQLTKIVVLAEGWAQQCATQHFSDVPPTDPFYCYVETAYSHGIISGYADGTFRPGNNVTRAQLCKIVVLAEGWTNSCPQPGHFSDVPLDNPFFCYVETAYNHGIITGYADGTFRPGNSATRGQISKIVYQAITQP